MSIIVEGPDGTGKSTLISLLMAEYPSLWLHPRFATAQGPMDRLGQRVWEDMETLIHDRHAVYDRHPLISEYVYGPMLRGAVDPSVRDVGQHLRERVSFSALVIWCHTEEPVLDAEPQMEGVVQSWHAIARSYGIVRALWPGWRGVSYDFNDPHSYNAVSMAVERYITEGKAA